MTCVIALKHKNKTYFGSDSCATFGDLERKLTGPKVIKLNDQMLVGYAGMIRGSQLMKHVDDWLPVFDTEKQTLENYMCRTFSINLMDLFKQCGYSANDLGVEEHSDNYLVGIHGRLFLIDPAFQVVETTEPYYAIGSGSSYAYGVLHHIYNNQEIIDPESTITKALEASIGLCSGVTAPIHIRSI